MIISTQERLRALLFAATATGALSAYGLARADTTPAPTADQTVTATSDQGASAVGELMVTAATRTTRSSVEISGHETQKLLPGISPLKAIETLPGVNFETADPWGNNEQNESLFVHGFATQQLGYTMDGMPLGDQQYGNYNGLSVSRALTSENVDHVILSSGAGSLGVASSSNLGGAIETFSRDPAHELGADLRETLGSYDTTRTFARVDSGEFGPGGDTRAYLSYLHYDAQAWDFDGHQRGDQLNLKAVRESGRFKWTFYGDWVSKIEPNEDAVNIGNQQTAAGAAFIPYTRPFLYPDIAKCIANVAPNPLTNKNLPGSPPIAQGNNFSNCFSAAQRSDLLGYAKVDYKVTDNVTWSTQGYYHYDYSRGIVAGPINQAGLPGLFATYFPGLVVGGSSTSAGTLANISNLFGGTGYEVRTTEYRINRGGVISDVDWQLGDHQIEAGIWYEHNEPAQHRVWYPFSAANNDLSPYDVPRNPAVFVQYAAQFYNDDTQLHLQDQWRVIPSLLLQAGFKSSLQTANGEFQIEQKNPPVLPAGTLPTVYPSGTIVSNNWFLPQFGAVWDVTQHEQLFVNAQQNMRQFIPYGAGSNFFGFSPWSLGTQAAFNLFKTTVKPETSWTYEGGARTHRDLDFGILSSIDGQASIYHVDFSNRLLNVAPYNFINPAPAILVNVGGVTTNGADLAGTLNFGEHFHVYDAISYNKSTYDADYNSGTGAGGVALVVHTGGKWVPDTPDWLEKFIVSANNGPAEIQLSGDYVGRRYATYTNDLQVPATFLMGLEASYELPVKDGGHVRSAKISANLTNLLNAKGISTLVVTSASGGYQGYPIAPRMGFVTLQATF